MRNLCKKDFFKLCSYVLIFSLLFTSSFASTLVSSAKKAKVTSVKATNVKAKKLNLVVGDSFKLKVTVKAKPSTTANKKVTYQTTNKKVASVTSSGKVKGLKAGTAKIMIASKVNPKKSVTIKVTVKKKVLIKSLKLSDTFLELYDDEEEDTLLDVSISPKSATNKELKWSSSNEDVADVDEDGYVTPYSEGTATIKVSTTDGSKKSATCKVTVLSSDDEEDEDDSEDEEEEDEEDSEDDSEDDSE